MVFPAEYESHKYSLIHFKFFLQYAMLAKIDIKYARSNEQVFIADGDNLYFGCVIDNTPCIFDYSDHAHKNWLGDHPGPYFKFQSNPDADSRIIPIGPPIVGVKNKLTKGQTMREYMTLRETFKYDAGKRVLCKQLPNGAATERRRRVHTMLSSNFKHHDINADADQYDFWKAHQHSIAVCVPGATNNMIDRGQMELFGLGVCTISPVLNTVLPYNQLATPGVHYIKCADDYSDLIDIINQLYNNLNFANQIGHNARELFESYFSPVSYWKWILSNL